MLSHLRLLLVWHNLRLCLKYGKVQCQVVSWFLFIFLFFKDDLAGLLMGENLMKKKWGRAWGLYASEMCVKKNSPNKEL